MKNTSPTNRQPAPHAILLSALAFAGLLSLAACAGGTGPVTVSGGGGGGGGTGGGGGSQNVPPCTFNAPASGGSTTAAGANTTINDRYFGMHLAGVSDPWPSSLIPNFQIGSQRLWDSAVAWSQINTASGVYDFSNLDTWLADDQSHGVDTLYTLARTPTWASSVPNDSSCSDSSNGPGQCDPPLDLNSDGSGADDIWIAWVSALAAHSQANKNAGLTGISYYEIWNEWNVTTSWNPTYASVAQLVRMEQDARCVVEGPPSGKQCNPNSVFPSGTALDPTAKIVTPSPVSAHTQLASIQTNLSVYFQTSVNGYPGGAFADVIGFHGYVGTTTTPGTTSVPCPVAEDVNTVLTDMNTTLTAYPASASGKALFNTEGGWSKADDEGFTDEDEQAAFLPRYLLLQQSADISRVYWYKWDSNLLGSLYNTTTDNATKAATAYGETVAWTNGATVSKACTASGTVWTCGYSRPSYSGLAVWDASQDCTATACPTTTFNVPSGGYIEYRDVAGNVNSLNGAGSVQIGAKPILLETAPLP